MCSEYHNPPEEKQELPTNITINTYCSLSITGLNKSILETQETEWRAYETAGAWTARKQTTATDTPCD